MDNGFTVLDKRGVDGGDQPTVKEEVKEPAKAEQVNKAPKPKPFTQRLFDEDILGPWIAAGMFPQKYNIDRATGLVVDSTWSYPDPNLPWVMVNNDGTRECDFYKDVERLYHIIPPPCSCCWKVVVMPKTVLQLFQLLEVEEAMVKKDPYCFCKCGIEKREEVERNYGGYFYCNDLMQGLTRLEQVRQNVHQLIDPSINVILKRGCTELERAYGPSDKWDSLWTPEAQATWDRLLSVFKTTKQFCKQPALIQRHIKMLWLAYAASIGDPSIPELNGGSKMYPGYVTYEMPKAEQVQEEEVSNA